MLSSMFIRFLFTFSLISLYTLMIPNTPLPHPRLRSYVQAGLAIPGSGLELRYRQIENTYKLLVSTSCWALFEMRLFSCNSKETEFVLMVLEHKSP